MRPLRDAQMVQSNRPFVRTTSADAIGDAPQSMDRVRR